MLIFVFAIILFLSGIWLSNRFSFPFLCDFFIWLLTCSILLVGSFISRSPYFYDLDNEWYYITRGPFQIKIPLGLINNNLDENNDEFKYILTVGDKVLRYIMEEYRVTHPEFNDFIINEGYDWKTVVEDIIEDDKLLIMNLYSKYKAIYQYFDDWIVIKTDENYEDITEIIAKKKEKHHIETNVW